MSLSIIVAHLESGVSPLVVHLMRESEQRKQLERFSQEILVRVADLRRSQPGDSRLSGLSLPPATDLTARETAILGLLSLGRSTEEIAAELFISHATVRNHVKHILTKLQCRSRLEAVIRAVEWGLS